MAASNEFLAHCIELLSSLGRTRTRPMFGGHGFYVDDVFIALEAFERLYLKVDDLTRARFEAAGCERFVYEMKGQPTSLPYYTAPEEAMESPALMRPWAWLAMEAALRARQAPAPRRATTDRTRGGVGVAAKQAPPKARRKTPPKAP